MVYSKATIGLMCYSGLNTEKADNILMFIEQAQKLVERPLFKLDPEAHFIKRVILNNLSLYCHRYELIFFLLK